MTSSVALCTYNGEKYISEQLDSILNQTFPIGEIVICDDCSTDSTQKILQEYQKKFPQIFKIFINKSNLGYVKNFEKALALCNGELVFLCDQDDIWNPEKIEKTIKIFEKRNEINVLCHNISLTGINSNNSSDFTYWQLENFVPSDNITNLQILKKLLYTGNVFPGMSMAIRNSFLKKNLPLKKINNIIIHDYELLLLALNENSLYVENSILGKYRIHKNQKIGYNRFLNRKTEAENMSKENLYAIFRRYQFVKTVAEILHLNKNIITDYHIYCKEKYNEYLQSFNFVKKITEHLKLKYYYKIFSLLK